MPDARAQSTPPTKIRGPVRGHAVEDRRVLRAVTRERTRIADTLRDDAIAKLIRARHQLRALATEDDGARAAVLTLLGDVSDDLHRVTAAIHEDVREPLPLATVLGHVARATRATIGVQVTIDPRAEGYHDPLLRDVVRELLRNVVRHAGATRASVDVTLDGGSVRLDVADDGRGLDPAAVRAGAGGHRGLQRIEQFAVCLGGSLRVTAGVPSGTRVTVHLPATGLRHEDDELPSAPLHAAAASGRQGHTSQAILSEADDRDALLHRGDLSALTRDREADARDVIAEARDAASAEAEAEAEHGMEPSVATLAHRLARVRSDAASLRAAGRADRRSSAGDRERGARGRLHAVRDRTVLAGWLSLAETDALTGARSRASGLGDLDREIERARRAREALTVAFVDVDGLKHVNDTAGHAAGDALLQHVVTCIAGHLRSYDLVIRIGGDEFLCVLSRAARHEATARFTAVAAALAQVPGGGSISAGFAELQPGQDARDLIARADADLLRHRGARRRR